MEAMTTKAYGRMAPEERTTHSIIGLPMQLFTFEMLSGERIKVRARTKEQAQDLLWETHRKNPLLARIIKVDIPTAAPVVRREPRYRPAWMTPRHPGPSGRPPWLLRPQHPRSA